MTIIWYVIDRQYDADFIMPIFKVIVSKFSQWRGCSYYAYIIFVNSFAQTKFHIEEICLPIYTKKVYTNVSLQDIVNPV